MFMAYLSNKLPVAEYNATFTSLSPHGKIFMDFPTRGCSDFAWLESKSQGGPGIPARDVAAMYRHMRDNSTLHTHTHTYISI